MRLVFDGPAVVELMHGNERVFLGVATSVSLVTPKAIAVPEAVEAETRPAPRTRRRRAPRTNGAKAEAEASEPGRKQGAIKALVLEALKSGPKTACQVAEYLKTRGVTRPQGTVGTELVYLRRQGTVQLVGRQAGQGRAGLWSA